MPSSGALPLPGERAHLVLGAPGSPQLFVLQGQHLDDPCELLSFGLGLGELSAEFVHACPKAVVLVCERLLGCGNLAVGLDPCAELVLEVGVLVGEQPALDPCFFS